MENIQGISSGKTSSGGFSETGSSFQSSGQSSYSDFSAPSQGDSAFSMLDSDESGLPF